MMTYLALDLAVTAVAIGAAWRHRKLYTTRPALLALAALMLLTFIFDNCIIMLHIVGYDPQHITGIKLGVAPIEDFFYSFVVWLLVPEVWRRNKRTHA